MTIEGDYTLFAHLETVYLGVLARRTLISTNTERVLRAANGKPIIFMPARHDHHRVQTGDGYAAYVAGAMLGTRDRRHLRRAGVVVGRTRRRHRPARAHRRVRRRHRARGDKFADWAPDDLRITVLVDFDNDSVATALAVADALGPKLWGVRLDTSGQLVDRSLWDEMGDFDPRGVNERLVRKVRAALDDAGHTGVRIVVFGRILGREDRGVRAPRRPRRRVRRRLVADPRRERLHGRHRRHRREAELEDRSSAPPEPAARACRSLARVLWDVDTQVDFVLPDGKLAVPGAAAAVPAMARLVGWARDNGVVHVASADDHELTDPEISAAPDFGNTYPPHCLRGTRGAQSVPATEQVDPLPLSHIAYPPGLVRELVAGRTRDPAAEEELRRVHEPERGGPARCARPGRGDRVRRRNGRLRPRRCRGPAPARSARRLRRGRGTWPRRAADTRRVSRNGVDAGVRFTTSAGRHGGGR